MYTRKFAAMWPAGDTQRVNYITHMRRVRGNDLIFMYANEIGIIGTGEALCGMSILSRFDHDRLRDYNNEGNNRKEYRIPVKWLIWHDNDPFGPIQLPPAAFRDITDKPALLISIWQRYFPTLPYPTI
jgi:hypothetical protein